MSTTHAALITHGRVFSAGRASEMLTSALVSEAFDYPIDVEYRDLRWTARAGTR